ncbi:hypothetical protein [Bradyrhizobium sp. USDA 3364]
MVAVVLVRLDPEPLSKREPDKAAQCDHADRRENGVETVPQAVENIGAGEGNRTLVFSLEGRRSASLFNDNSDKLPLTCPLSANGYFDVSEHAVIGA